MPTVSGPIIDGGGRPVNGHIHLRSTATYRVGESLVVPAVRTIPVSDGMPPSGFTIPFTPDGVDLEVIEDFDGMHVTRRRVGVPNLEAVAYADLVLLHSRPPAAIDGNDILGAEYDFIDGGTL